MSPMLGKRVSRIVHRDVHFCVHPRYKCGRHPGSPLGPHAGERVSCTIDKHVHNVCPGFAFPACTTIAPICGIGIMGVLRAHTFKVDYGAPDGGLRGGQCRSRGAPVLVARVAGVCGQGFIRGGAAQRCRCTGFLCCCKWLKSALTEIIW